ncbi:MAG: hypothetical protein IPM99_07015 [Rubrivivax sp.]|nr:hypothetical protein [Rubrivivax sp.]
MWDRWRDRPFWASQQVIRHVREASDVVLYLVNAGEQPEAAGCVAPGDGTAGLGRQAGAGAAQPARPAARPAPTPTTCAAGPRTCGAGAVRQVLPLDAFARCWVQECALWQAVQAALPANRQGDGRAAAGLGAPAPARLRRRGGRWPAAWRAWRRRAWRWTTAAA